MRHLSDCISLFNTSDDEVDTLSITSFEPLFVNKNSALTIEPPTPKPNTYQATPLPILLLRFYSRS